ncbi:unnamed protein product [Cladocopium goreaui]|uniref:Uncharacterized protein n=1 Tax=Cladocopium goreaui TaxID=2562237 RepID=A0A9P1G7H4_9DINO|nr:unnamed protein product [Cladocopium goreaui]
MAPEVVRLQLDLASERRCREQLEKKVVNPTQRSPRVPPVNKATWSFESILPRERKSLKAPEQGSQPVQVSKETSETLQNLDDLDGATAQKEFRTEQSTALSDLSATASASLERENEGDNHVSDESKTTAASGQASAESAQSAAEAIDVQGIATCFVQVTARLEMPMRDVKAMPLIVKE